MRCAMVPIRITILFNIIIKFFPHQLDIEELKFCVGAVYLSCKLKGAQRPGAASSMTIDEYNDVIHI